MRGAELFFGLSLSDIGREKIAQNGRKWRKGYRQRKKLFGGKDREMEAKIKTEKWRQGQRDRYRGKDRDKKWRQRQGK